MDWMNRGSRPNPTTNQGASVTSAPASGGGRKRGGDKLNKLFRITSIVLLFSATILAVALLFSLVFSKDTKESKYVDDSKLQAVFLNGGQVYFGNIKSLNSQYLSMNNIYYLRVNQQVQPDPNAETQANSDISLVKLGCELHGPVDQMVINRDQVLFWENLKADGQVAKAVDQYIKANPNGQKCETTTGTTDQSGNNATTPTTNSTENTETNQNANQ